MRTVLFIGLWAFMLSLLSGQTVVSIKGDQFHINGKPTYEGRYWKGNKVEGLLINSRMVQGIFDDIDPNTSHAFAYPDTEKWDAERNNLEFVGAMSLWRSYGLNCFTLNMQGGSPVGYQGMPYTNPGFNKDGSLRAEYMKRLERVLKRADELEMVVILGIFYFRQDEYLSDEAAIKNATNNLIDWLFEKGYRNVLIEICNETDVKLYDHDILKPGRVHELINLVKGKKKNGYRYLVSTSFGGMSVPTRNVVKASDFLLIHGNGAKEPEMLTGLAERTRKVRGYRPMPVVNNEDDHFDFGKEVNNFTTSIENYVSWGYLDFRFPGESDFVEGYQSVPVDWGINSARKRGFFNKVAEITGARDSRLYLELLSTEPLPVIDSLNADSRDIPSGFEAGSTVKLTINGETAYYMVTSAMASRPDGPYRWTHMRTELWKSKDGFNWHRHRILFHPHFDQRSGLWQLTGSPFPFFDEGEDRWYIYFNYMAFNGIRNWDTPCLLRRAGAKEPGMAGILGEFEFPGDIVAPSGIAHPTDAEASSISPPFRAADGRWYAFLGGGPKPFDEKSGRWWALIVKGDSPAGPFTYIPQYAPVPVMDPTGYVENPMPMKLTGPETGKEYWAIIFNYLKGEVTTGKNSEIGFSSSHDGLNWNEKDCQIIDLREGLPEGVEEWWKVVRVPHKLVDEGNGIYTCFYSAYDREGIFEGMGRATFRLRENVR